MKTQYCATVSLLIMFVAGCVRNRELPRAQEPIPYGYALVSPGQKFGSLPPPAQNAVRAEAGAAEISDIARIPGTSVPTYKVYFRNYELYPPLYVDADGSILHPDLQVAMGAAQDTFGTLIGGGMSSLRLTELPATVQKVIQQRAPNVSVAHISKQTWGDRVVYIISFADEIHHPRLYVAADGTVLNEGPK
jgi:hypothetical protein